MSEAYADNTLAIGDLVPGDILCLLNRNNSRYWVGVYLGESKLLVSENKSGADLTYKIYDFGDDTDGSKFASFIEKDALESVAWENYLVIRPSCGFYDINDPTYDPTLEELDVDAALAKISDLTADNWKKTLSEWAIRVYAAVDLDISSYFPSGTTGSNVNLMMEFAAQWDGTKDYVGTVAETAEQAHSQTVYAMLEKDMICGPKFKEYKNATIDLADMQVGDLLYLSDRTNKMYWTCVYQGNGKFLTSYAQSSGVSGYMILDVSEDGAWADLLTSATVEDVTATWEYCFVLRPANLLRG